MLSNFFRNGGWGMFPTAFFGFFLVASAVVALIRPEQRYRAVARGFGLLTVTAGALGLATGLIKTFHYIWKVPPEQQVAIAAEGCAESLNNLVLAFMFVLVAGLLLTASAIRVARKPRAAG